jgi:hypothetical protein
VGDQTDEYLPHQVGHAGIEHPRIGVEPICRVLTEHGWPIAASTVRAFRKRSASSRQRRDEEPMEHIARVHKENYGVFGARKVWLTLNRLGIPVAKCKVERLMRRLGVPQRVAGTGTGRGRCHSNSHSGQGKIPVLHLCVSWHLGLVVGPPGQE